MNEFDVGRNKTHKGPQPRLEIQVFVYADPLSLCCIFLLRSMWGAEVGHE